MALVVVFPVAYLYFRNFSLVQPIEVLTTFLQFFVAAIVVLTGFCLVLRDFSKAVFITNFFMLGALLFEPLHGMIARVFPFIYYWHLVYIFLTILTLLIFVVASKVNRETTAKMNIIVAAIFGFLVLSNLAMSIPQIAKEWNKSKASSDPVLIESSGINAQENVYLFIFDEYSGQDALLRYNDYDNSSFYEELVDLGFNVSPHSKNYTFTTNIEVTNLLNLSLSLNVDNYSNKVKDEIMKRPSLFSLYDQYGYSINVISDQSRIPANAEGVDSIYIGQGSLDKAETFQLVLLKNTIFYPFFTARESIRAKEIKALFVEMQDAADMQEQKQLTVGYFMIPHNPWVLDEHGNQISERDRLNWKDPDIYLGQLKYVSSNILDVVAEIIQKDPNAIILLQSDHAYRLPYHLEMYYDEIIENRSLENQYMRNILNAVYFKGQTLDIENLSGLNTLLKVINTQFSIQLPYAEPAD